MTTAPSSVPPATVPNASTAAPAATASDAATPVSASKTASGGMFSTVNAYPAFRLLLIGTLATNTAFWMYQVAVGWLALELTDSPAFVGLAGFVSGIPLLLLALPAGVMIDRFDGRRVLLLGQVGVLVVSSLFAVLVGVDLVRPAVLLVLAALYGSVMSFVFPSRTTMVPSLVARADLTTGIALNAATQNVTRVVGPSLAGVLIAVIGVSGTFALAAALQIGALITTWNLPRLPASAESRKRMEWSAFTVGFKIVAASPFLTAIILLALAPTVLVMPYINLMPVFARDELGLGSSGLGLLLGAVGLGTVAGALSVAQWERLRSWGPSQVVTASAFSVFVLLFALLTPPTPLAMLLLFASGWTSAAYLAMNQTQVQLNVDDEVRGRVFSVYLLTWGMLPIGQLAVGALTGLVGTPPAVAISCAAGLVCIALIVRRFPSLAK